MKTIHIFMGLIFMMAMPFSCETDNIAVDNPIDKIEHVEMAMELDFEMLALELERQKIGNDPKNEEEKKRLQFIENRLEVIYDERRGFTIPVPRPPNPCEPGPIFDCPVPIKRIRELLIQDKIQEFSFVFKSIEKEEVLYKLPVEDLEKYEEGLIAIKTGFEEIDLPEMFIVEVFKIVDDQKIQYQFAGIF